MNWKIKSVNNNQHELWENGKFLSVHRLISVARRELRKRQLIAIPAMIKEIRHYKKLIKKHGIKEHR